MGDHERMFWFCLTMGECVLFFLMGCAALYYRGKWIIERRRASLKEPPCS